MQKVKYDIVFENHFDENSLTNPVVVNGVRIVNIYECILTRVIYILRGEACSIIELQKKMIKLNVHKTTTISIIDTICDLENKNIIVNESGHHRIKPL